MWQEGQTSCLCACDLAGGPGSAAAARAAQGGGRGGPGEHRRRGEWCHGPAAPGALCHTRALSGLLVSPWENLPFASCGYRTAMQGAHHCSRFPELLDKNLSSSILAFATSLSWEFSMSDRWTDCKLLPELGSFWGVNAHIKVNAVLWFCHHME